MVLFIMSYYRAPEVIFQPPVVGVDQCGLSEAMELVINSFPADVQQRLVNVCMYITNEYY